MKVLKQNNNLIYKSWVVTQCPQRGLNQAKAPHLEGGEENKKDQKKRIN